MKKLLFFALMTLCAFFVGCCGREKPEDDPNNPLWKIIPDTAWYKKNQSDSVFTITTAEELAGLAILVEDRYSMLGKTILLGNNISFVPKSRSASSPPHYWQAIGNSEKPFKGTFDGAGFVVSGIHLYNTDAHQGFFGWLEEAAVKNLGVSDLYVDASRDKVGGLVGCSRLSGVYNCYTTGEVKGGDYWVGGLVGYNDGGWIENSYSKCKVSGNYAVGGLVGFSGGSQYAKITNCYSTGAVSAKTKVGGFAGENTAGSNIANCYYDKETSGQADTINGEGRTTAQMKQLGNYVNWNFADVWKIDSSKNSGYPYLQVYEH